LRTAADKNSLNFTSLCVWRIVAQIGKQVLDVVVVRHFAL